MLLQGVIRELRTQHQDLLDTLAVVRKALQGPIPMQVAERAAERMASICDYMQHRRLPERLRALSTEAGDDDYARCIITMRVATEAVAHLWVEVQPYTKDLLVKEAKSSVMIIEIKACMRRSVRS